MMNSQMLGEASGGPKDLRIFEDSIHSVQNIPYKVMPLQVNFLTTDL